MKFKQTLNKPAKEMVMAFVDVAKIRDGCYRGVSETIKECCIGLKSFLTLIDMDFTGIDKSVIGLSFVTVLKIREKF